MKTAALLAILIPGALAGAARAQQPAPLPNAVQTFDVVWKTINDTYYDPSFRGIDWNAVRDELRPQAERASTMGELRAVLRRMLDRLGESHFAVLSWQEDAQALSRDLSGSPGFEYRPHGDRLLVTRVDAGTPAHEAGVRAGQLITRVGDTNVADLAARLPRELDARLRLLELWRTAMRHLRGPVGSRLSIVSAGVPRIFTLVDEPGAPITLGSLGTMHLEVRADAVETPSGASAGVIGFNVWMAAADAQVAAAMDRFRASRGIVIDLRGNPGGMAAMIMGISGHFFDTRTALGTMKMRDSVLTFFANPRRARLDGTVVDPFKGPVAILVDGLTGSASECFAGGMQSVGRARVFGETSMGQALPASFTRLPNGDTLLYAIADFVTANGTRLEGRGVVPDEAVPLDPAALANGRDPVLAAALAWIDRQR